MTDSPKWRSEQDEERDALGMWRLLCEGREMAGLITVDGMIHPRGLEQLVELLNEQAAEVDRLRAQHSRALDALGVKPHD